MTRQCSVILNNKAVTVVRFDNVEIQFPSIHKDAETVFVKFEDGKYTIVENIEEEEKEVISHKKRNQKKTTVENDTATEADETVTVIDTE